MINSNISALMYHGVHNSAQCEGNYDGVYSVSCTTFCQHLNWLQQSNYQAVTLEQALTQKIQNPVIITFDDGDVSNYLVAFPELVKRGMLAEFYITTDWINTQGYMSEQQLKEMHNAGMSIQSHSKSHPYLSDINSAELYNELMISKNRLDEITNDNVHTIALPGGRGLDQVLPLYKKLGYKTIATSILRKNTSTHQLNRITVTSGFNLELLSSLVTRSGAIYYKAIIKQFVFNLAKKILGNHYYEVVRSKLLRES
ncbi:MAG: peptidoglycan/xylan/chitin deacetylase (PgdA/CDA1 family) [Polaribacter sp.]|jgi:peptidoglycan/xylan/chitin deacetylase (PgdA/CDA1 family)